MGGLKNGSRIRTSAGTLRVRGLPDLHDPSTLVSPSRLELFRWQLCSWPRL